MTLYLLDCKAVCFGDGFGDLDGGEVIGNIRFDNETRHIGRFETPFLEDVINRLKESPPHIPPFFPLAHNNFPVILKQCETGLLFFNFKMKTIFHKHQIKNSKLQINSNI